MTRLLDLLEDYFELKDYAYCRIDGSVTQQVRQAEVTLVCVIETCLLTLVTD